MRVNQMPIGDLAVNISYDKNVIQNQCTKLFFIATSINPATNTHHISSKGKGMFSFITLSTYVWWLVTRIIIEIHQFPMLSTIGSAVKPSFLRWYTMI